MIALRLPTKLERYREALQQFENAAGAIAEAITELRLAGIHESDISDTRIMYSPTPSRILSRLESTITALQQNRCEDCGDLVMEHGAALECDPAKKAAYQPEPGDEGSAA